MLNWVQVFQADELSEQPAERRRVPTQLRPQPGDDHHRRRRGASPARSRSTTSTSTSGSTRGRPLRPHHRLLLLRVRRHGPGAHLQRGAGRRHRRAADPGLRRPLRRRGPGRATSRPPCRSDLQAKAREQLGQRRGAVVALDPRTGAVLALWDYPSYDPNALATPRLRGGQGGSGLPRSPRQQQPADRHLVPGPLLPRARRSRSSSARSGLKFGVVTAGLAQLPGRGVLHAAGHEPAAGQLPHLRRDAVPDPGRVLQHVLRPHGRREPAARTGPGRGRGLRLRRRAADRPPRRRSRRTSRTPGAPGLRRLPRPVRHRAVRGAGHAAPDGAGRRGHRQRRRDHGALRRRGAAGRRRRRRSTPTTRSIWRQPHQRRGRRHHAGGDAGRRHRPGTATNLQGPRRPGRRRPRPVRPSSAPTRRRPTPG